jgi:EmrB/QacA subfamily drug resistance transporter
MSDRSLKRSALTLAVISSFVTPIMASSVNLALPALGREFALDAVTLSWIQTGYLLATAVGLLPAGRLADIYGRKRIYTMGMALFGISCLAAALAPGVVLLMTARIVQGLASAMIFATGVAILSAVFPPGERGQAMGLTVGAVYVGLTLGPFVGGILTQHLGWRSVMAATIPLSVLAWWVAAYRINAEWAETKGEPFDYTGAVIYGASLVALIQGLTHLPGWEGVGLIVLGVLIMAAFVWWENRVKIPPLFPLKIFQTNRSFALSNLAALINYCATYGVTFLLSLYLQQVKGLSPQAAGIVLIAQPIVMAALSPLAGRLSDRIQPRIVASLGMGITAVGLWLLSVLDAQTGQGYIIICLIITGFGFGTFSSPNINAIMSSVEKRYYSTAAGSMSSMRILGQMTSMGIVTSVLAIYVGRIQITQQNLGGLVSTLQAAFIIFGILCVAGVFASLSRGKLERGAPGQTGGKPSS